MPKTELQLINRTEEILEDSDNKSFNVPTTTAQLQDSLSEVSAYKPQIVRHTKMAVNSAKLGTQLTGHTGREIDISDIDYRYIDWVEYPVGNYPPTRCAFEVYGNTLFLKISDRPSAASQVNTAGTTQVLTGTVTFTDGSPAVTGSGTAFTSELEPGYYIAKSGGSNWYRVSAIASDTALTLSINCDSDDDGADTAGATLYWYEYVYLFCAKNHYVAPTQTDFAGTINAGVATGYAEGTWQIDVDALGTGTMPKDMLFTIAGTEGVYRITEDATITTNEATLKISPRLKGRATENAIVTFIPSSLTPQLEEFLCELTAAKLAINGVGDARTAQKNAVTAYGLANARIDAMTGIITQLTTDIGTTKTAINASLSTAKSAIVLANAEVDSAASACAAIDSAIGDYTSAANMAATEMGLADDAAKKIDDVEERYLAIDGEAETEFDLAVTGAAHIDDIEERFLATAGVAQLAIEAANTQLDFAVTATAVLKDAINTEDDDIDTEITAAKTQLDTAVVDLTTDVDAVNNVITRGSNVPQNLISKAMGLVNAANGYIRSAEALKNPNSQYGVEAEHELRLAMAQLREAQKYITLETALVTENVAALRAHLATGQGFISLENAVVSENAAATRAHIAVGQGMIAVERTLTGENALSVRSYVQTAAGYVREAMAYVNADARTVSSYGTVLRHEANSAIVDLRQAGGYFNEAAMSIRVSTAVYAGVAWGEKKYAMTIDRLQKSVGVRISYATE